MVGDFLHHSNVCKASHYDDGLKLVQIGSGALIVMMEPRNFPT